MTGVSEPNVAVEPPAPKPSGAIRLLWWCDLLMVVPGGLLIFLVPPLFLIAVAAAFIVVVDSVTDRDLTREQRLIGLSLSAGAILAGLLAALIADSFGYFGERGTATVLVLTLAGTIAWVLVLMAVKPRAWQITKKNEWKP